MVQSAGKYPTFDVMGVFSGINAGDCCRWVHSLMPVLEELLGQKLALPPKSNCKTQYYYSEDLYKLGHKVENFFCRIKIHRRVATRYKKLAETYIGFVTSAAILDWPRRSF